MEIRTRKGSLILVDETDHAWLSALTWSVSSTGYAVRNEWRSGKQRTVLMHRLLLGLQPGDRCDVDHINGNRLDNRRVNLRVCTRSQNLWNARGMNGRSGLKGVSWHATSKKWRARMTTEKGVHRHLGVFDTPELANEFYTLAVQMVHGEFAYQNGGDHQIPRP
ncbi:HNH endonuclease [Burkholderia gladioli]|uniref:HNH endonuclease n=1 Tax=Burkholderia gladioli TaxID=28095 RepID=UPI00163FFEB5|nr:HNH endonuclease [Burkholderia gladioli]